MKTLTKHENLKGKEFMLQAVEYNGVLTYGIQQGNIIFEDVSCNRLAVQGMLKLMNGEWETDKNKYELLHSILVDVTDKYQEELMNL